MNDQTKTLCEEAASAMLGALKASMLWRFVERSEAKNDVERYARVKSEMVARLIAKMANVKGETVAD